MNFFLQISLVSITAGYTFPIGDKGEIPRFRDFLSRLKHLHSIGRPCFLACFDKTDQLVLEVFAITEMQDLIVPGFVVLEFRSESLPIPASDLIQLFFRVYSGFKDELIDAGDAVVSRFCLS